MSSGHNRLQFGSSEVAGGGGSHHQVRLEWADVLSEGRSLEGPRPEALLIGRVEQARLGDLLIPQVLESLLDFSKSCCAGLVAADWTDRGGPRAGNYGEAALELRGSRLKLIHFGGDVLSSELVEAYGKALQGEARERFRSLAEISDAGELRRYARRRTGQVSDLAYVLEAEGEFNGAQSGFHAVGLSEPGRLSSEGRSRLLSALRKASFVGVRDEVGAAYLESEGIAVERMPCALTVLPEVGARRLREARESESLETIRRRFPNGWIAVETSGVRNEDAEPLLYALREVGDREDLGLVFFEANPAGEGRDRRLKSWLESLPEWQAAEFGSEDLWEKTALLLHSRLYCGGDLSSRILCMAGGVARINVPVGTAEALSYGELWEHDDVPIEFAAHEDWAVALTEALEVPLPLLQAHAAWLRERYHQQFEKFRTALGLDRRPSQAEPATRHERYAVERRRAKLETLPAGAHPSHRPSPQPDAWISGIPIRSPRARFSER